MNPTGNSIAVNAEAAAPVRNGVSLAVQRYLSDSALVVVLLNPRRPLAVAWLVVAVAINALKRVLIGGPFSHIGKESLKRIEPAVANVDSTASVVRVGAEPASLAHCPPNAILGGFARSVSQKASAGLVFLKASAAFGVSAVQFVRGNASHRSALTAANPLRNVAFGFCGSFNGRQATKLHSSQINFGWHGLTV